MWLINTATLLLENFQACPVGRYAILSHRWEDDEVTFDDAQSGIETQSKKGAWKIVMCCLQAQREGMKYAWVDTCCIDKRSSAELSEAINSMYQWYAESRVCYVYMNDVYGTSTSASREKARSEDCCSPTDKDIECRFDKDAFRGSQWFTRGWTLQELIAPAKASFYDANWDYLGDKLSLAPDLSTVTGIDEPVLHGEVSIRSYSIAQRMSWASTRITTRIEDMAYSLLGIFDVNMPLLYGEGVNAFRRLQEAILEATDDESIFVWDGVSEGGSGLLAPGVANFARSNKIIPYPQDKLPWPRHEYAMTNKGLKLEAGISPFAVDTYFMSLECVSASDKFDTQRIHIFLRPVSDLEPIFQRVSYHGIDWASTLQWKEQRSRIVGKHVNLPLDDDFVAFELMLKANSSRKSIYVPQRVPITRQGNTPTTASTTTTTKTTIKTTSPPCHQHSDDDNGNNDDICITVSRSTKLQRSTLLSKTYPETWTFPLPAVQPGYKQLSLTTFTYSAHAHAQGFEVDLSDHWTRAVALKVGFDFAFNPVCLLAVAKPHGGSSRVSSNSGNSKDASIASALPPPASSWTIPQEWPGGTADQVMKHDHAAPAPTVWWFHMPRRRGKLGLCVRAESSSYSIRPPSLVSKSSSSSSFSLTASSSFSSAYSTSFTAGSGTSQTSTSSGTGGGGGIPRTAACYIRLEIKDHRRDVSASAGTSGGSSSQFAWKFSLHEERIDSVGEGIFEGRDWVTYFLE